MSGESSGGTPRSFLIIAVVALLWNLMGVLQYIMLVTTGPEALAKMSEAERALIESMPAWATGAFAIAVFGGLLASVGLLLKKAWCMPLFLLSLIGIIVQFSYWLLIADTIAVHGPGAVVMPLLVTAIAVFLVWYSRDARARGSLS
jgi:hypothetical protein